MTGRGIGRGTRLRLLVKVEESEVLEEDAGVSTLRAATANYEKAVEDTEKEEAFELLEKELSAMAIGGNKKDEDGQGTPAHESSGTSTAESATVAAVSGYPDRVDVGTQTSRGYCHIHKEAGHYTNECRKKYGRPMGRRDGQRSDGFQEFLKLKSKETARVAENRLLEDQQKSLMRLLEDRKKQDEFDSLLPAMRAYGGFRR